MVGTEASLHPGRRSSPEVAAGSERRAEIRAIAAGLFARKGFQNTTVREIADAAGILSGSLYHHFDSKDAIVDEILSEFVGALLADYAALVAEGDDPVSTLEKLVRHQFRALVDNRDAVTCAINDAYYLRRLPRLAYLDDTDAQVAELWLAVLGDGVESGALRPDLDPALVWTFIRGAVWSTVQQTGRDGSVVTDDLVDAFLETLLGGIATPEA